MKIVSLGEVWLHLLPIGVRIGGAPVNFAWYCQELGAQSILVSAVGEDIKGTRVLRELQQHGLPTDYVAVLPGEATGTVTPVFHDAGSVSYDVGDNVAWDLLAFSPQLKELAAGADAVCFGTLGQRSPVSAATIEQFLISMKPDALKLFDSNLQGGLSSAALLDHSFTLCNAAQINQTDLPVICKTLGLPEDTGCQELVRRYELRLLALVKGVNGAVFYTPEKEYEQDGFSDGELVNKAAAEDCFSAVLCVGLLNAAPLADINRAANRSAAYAGASKSMMRPFAFDTLESMRRKGVIK